MIPSRFPPVEPSPEAVELGSHVFSSGVCDTLFQAVLVDDVVDAETPLPHAVELDFDRDQLLACFELCRQLWTSGFDRDALLGHIGALLQSGELDGEAAIRFKHIRAKFKHFRYAHALYGHAHAYPPMLDRVTICMGQVQDAFRGRRHGLVRMRALQLRLLLARLPVRRLYVEANRLLPATPAAFRALLMADAAALRELTAHGLVTGPTFHAARKIVGRQVSFWDTVRTLAPTTDRHRMSRALSAINGLMGELHDRMVARRAVERGSYGAAFDLPSDIRDRIDALVIRYDPSPHAHAHARSRPQPVSDGHTAVAGSPAAR